MSEAIIVAIIEAFLRELGLAAAGPIVTTLARRLGPDVVQGHLDQYQVARAAADAAADAKFGHRK